VGIGDNGGLSKLQLTDYESGSLAKYSKTKIGQLRQKRHPVLAKHIVFSNMEILSYPFCKVNAPHINDWIFSPKTQTLF